MWDAEFPNRTLALHPPTVSHNYQAPAYILLEIRAYCKSQNQPLTQTVNEILRDIIADWPGATKRGV